MYLENPDWTTFCCAMIHKDVFEKIGLLDEQFKFTGEDVDFCIRARKVGFGIKCVEDAEVWHMISINRFERLSFKRVYYHLRSVYLLFKKHGRKRDFIKYLKRMI